jgi:hypothetical protein
VLNHARSLLVNRAAAGPLGDVPGEELVDADFRPVALDEPLAALHAALFGADPDRHTLAYRARQYVELLHADRRLEGHVLSLDGRVSYRTVGRGDCADDLFDAAFQPAAAWLGAGPARQALFTGRAAFDAARGRAYHRWEVNCPEDTRAVLVRVAPAPAGWSAFDFARQAGFSGPLTLGTGTLAVNLEANQGAAWELVAVARPDGGPAEAYERLRAALAAGSGRTARLFGAAAAEPFRTFRNLWEQHWSLPLRLGGALLAFAYRLEAIRQGGA